MDGVQTMNLNDSTTDGTPVLFNVPEPVKTPIPQGLIMPKAPEKNISIQKEMDSTPISEIMDTPIGGVDARFNQPVYAQPPSMQPLTKSPTVNKNPLNLTDDQMEALFAGLVAVIAFSVPVQLRLASTVPQFLTEAGERSTMGALTSAIVAALLFYFGRRFLMPN
jgi:hypothetical protein